MESTNKYRVIDKTHPKYGKIVKCIPNGDLGYIDIKTGDVYSLEQVDAKPERHAAYLGMHFWRFGLFLFAREYIKYRSYQFGFGVDWIKHDDAYLDLECRVACFGFGIRFVWLSKASKLYAKINGTR